MLLSAPTGFDVDTIASVPAHMHRRRLTVVFRRGRSGE